MKNKELFEKLICSDNREDWSIACSLLGIKDMNHACHLLWKNKIFTFRGNENEFARYAYVRDFFYYLFDDLFNDNEEFWRLWNKYKTKIYDNN